MFCCSIVFAKDEITIEKMIPVYDENSGVIVAEENGIHSVVFNDKDQIVKYNIVLKNNTKRDISLSDIVLPESPEEFFKYDLNVAETSRNSYLHRNTLLYRLDKIHNMTGLNLKNFEDAVAFKILMQVYRLTT
jgi:carbohydrate diacid regulator